MFDRLVPSLRGRASGDDGFESWATLRLDARFLPDLPPKAWCAGLKEIANGAAGGTPSFVFKSGTADLNIVGLRWNSPAVGYGPGDSALDHTPEERRSLEEFARAIRVLEHVLRTLTHPVEARYPRRV